MGRRKIPLQDYVHLVGSIGLSCAGSENDIEKAIRALSLSISISRIQIILNEMNSVKIKIKILRKMAKIVLNASEFKRYNNILGKIESVFDERNHYIHSPWFFKVRSGNPSDRPYAQKYKRDGDTPHIPERVPIKYSELKKLEEKSIRWGIKLTNFNDKTIRAAVLRKHVAHIRKESRTLNKNHGKVRKKL